MTGESEQVAGPNAAMDSAVGSDSVVGVRPMSGGGDVLEPSRDEVVVALSGGPARLAEQLAVEAENALARHADIDPHLPIGLREAASDPAVAGWALGRLYERQQARNGGGPIARAVRELGVAFGAVPVGRGETRYAAKVHDALDAACRHLQGLA